MLVPVEASLVVVSTCGLVDQAILHYGLLAAITALRSMSGIKGGKKDPIRFVKIERILKGETLHHAGKIYPCCGVNVSTVNKHLDRCIRYYKRST